MEAQEIKRIILSSLKSEKDELAAAEKLENSGISYDFSDEFTEKILERLSGKGRLMLTESEYSNSILLIFRRVALTGIAAIILLLISIILGEGGLSIDSVLGMGDAYDESIICLITGN